MLRVQFASTIRDVHAEKSRSVVALRVEADIATRQALRHVLCRVIADGTGNVVIDVGEATFLDTAIVRSLGTARQLLGCRDRALLSGQPHD